MVTEQSPPFLEEFDMFAYNHNNNNQREARITVRSEKAIS